MRDKVQRYYGELLQSSADLKTDACCTIEDVPPYVSDAIAQIHAEVRARYYGCGLILPEALEGLQILDLGCGAGRDCYVLSRLVGDARAVIVMCFPVSLETGGGWSAST
jgi:2-polyprenyl-3-methyl-5-hydroxy-6-metoxy-1,4-benzoquinol methylase